MERRPLKRLGAMVASGLTLLVLAACNSGNSSSTTVASNGPAPQSATTYDSATWSSLKLNANVTKVEMASGTPVVTFTVTDQSGVPISGLAVPYNGSNYPGMTVYPPAVGSYPNFAFTFAKLEPATTTAPSRWVSYLVVGGTTAAPSLGFPEPNSTGNLVDNGGGSYTYTYSLPVTQTAYLASQVTLKPGQVLSDLDNINYEPSLVHRVGIVVGGNQPTSTAVTLSNANAHYDFIPSSGAPVSSGRDIVAEASCNSCHTSLSMHYPRFVGVNDPSICVTCHTDQMKFGYPEDAPAAATVSPAPANGSVAYNTSLLNASNTQRLYGNAMGVFPNMVHKIHMGSNLWYAGYNLHMAFNTITYPQDVRNCTTCHTGGTVPSSNANVTPQGDNWFSKPSRLACGACHDQVNFATGLNHATGGVANAYNDDGACAGCHDQESVQIEHQPVLAGNAVVASAQSGKTFSIASNPLNLPSNVPAGTKVHTVIGQIISVGITPNATYPAYLGNPTITFSLWADSTSTSTGGTSLQLNAQPGSSSATNYAMIAGIPADLTTFQGGPSVLVALGYPQDGITPADYNFETTVPLVGIWNKSGSGKTAGSIGGIGAAAVNGQYEYTVTLTGVFVPSGTNLMIGGLGNGSTLVQTNLQAIGGGNTTDPAYDFTYTPATNAGGLQVPFATVWQPGVFKTTVGGSTNAIARRTIVKQDACNACHSNLGAFGPTTNPAAPGTTTNFHSVTNNDATSCAMCHATNVNHTSGGFDVNAKMWIHGIHGNSIHEYPYAAEGNFPSITYPGILNNCEACHVPGSYDFSNATNAGQVPNLLWDSVFGTPSGTQVVQQTPGTLGSASAPAGAAPAAWGVTTGTSYGTAFTITQSGTGATIAQPSTNSLVSSPITAACMSCHDDMTWYTQHIKPYGGYWYTARSAVPGYTGLGGNLANTETCLKCHGAGEAEDIRTVHMNF